MDAFTSEMLKRGAARQSAYQIVNLLKRFIPEACQQEVCLRLEEEFYTQGMEITSIQQRLEMEELRRAALLTTPNPPLIFQNMETKK